MSWACKRCTFLNPSSQKSTCQICFSSESSSLPSSSSSSLASTPKWSCKACTFLNPYKNSNCEVCDTRAHVSSFSSFEDLNDTGPDSELDSSVGSVFLPLQPCKRMKISEPVGVEPDSAKLEEAGSGTAQTTLKILSYNVWFREDLEPEKRMKAIGDLIELHSPEIICFQEVTPNIYNIFKQSNWWRMYNCSGTNQMAFPGSYFCIQVHETLIYDIEIIGLKLLNMKWSIIIMIFESDEIVFSTVSIFGGMSPFLGIDLYMINARRIIYCSFYPIQNIFCCQSIILLLQIR
uniref:RanBP2-type domain-containing protein n=1 Tax=Cannabis sativa TaxID=3483 RepID=A0A803RCG2_CANSA